MASENDERPQGETPANDAAAPSVDAAPPAGTEEATLEAAPAAEVEPDPAPPVEPVQIETSASAARENEAEEQAAAVAEEPIPEVAAAPEIAPEAAAVAAAAEGPADPPAETRSFQSEEPEPFIHDDRRPGGDDGGDGKSGKVDAKSEIVEIAKTVFFALMIALVLRVLFFQPFTIPSASMEPNLYEGDYIIVSKWNYGYSKHSIPFSPPIFGGRLFDNAPQRGDIVVFKLPRDDKTDYIKRVIGLPGDQVQVRNNLLYINGVAVKDAPIGKIDVPTAFGFPRSATRVSETLPGGKVITTQDFGPDGELDNTGVYTVPAGHFFMMGDNRDNSIDSRVPQEWGVGLVPEENLVGKAQVILFSWKPGASLWNPLTWFTKLQPSRFFTTLK